MRGVGDVCGRAVCEGVYVYVVHGWHRILEDVRWGMWVEGVWCVWVRLMREWDVGGMCVG